MYGFTYIGGRCDECQHAYMIRSLGPLTPRHEPCTKCNGSVLFTLMPWERYIEWMEDGASLLVTA